MSGQDMRKLMEALTEREPWPVWRTADPILKKAVLFMDSDEAKNMSMHEVAEKFHKSHNIKTSLEDFKAEVENLYYAPTAPGSR